MQKKNKVCVSIFYHEGISCDSHSISNADILEIRLDSLPQEKLQQFDFLHLKSRLADLNFNKKILVTIRHKDEGGMFSGSESIRLKAYQKAIQSGIDYVDIEYKKIQLLGPSLKKLLPMQNLVLSVHIGKMSSTQLESSFNEMLTHSAFVYKLIFLADETGTCSLKPKAILNIARKKGVKAICHAMGEFGEASRILGAIWGNEWTYVSLDNNQTASGQFSLEDANNLYHLKDKKSTAKIFGLLGYPLVHSRSKFFHNQKFNDLGKSQEAVYVNFPSNHPKLFWETWKHELSGLSVTIPHKKSIANQVTHSSPDVKKLGVCNTVVKRSSKWHALNTDVSALAHCLKPFTNTDQSWLILGTGATAESAIYTLSYVCGVEKIFIIGRDKKKIERLQKKYQHVFSLDLKRDLSRVGGVSFEGIVQATSVGMYPNEGKCPDFVEWEYIFKKDMIVMDVIYNPLETLFLKKAKLNGCKVISGMEMFNEQAQEQSQLFSRIMNDG